MSMCIFNARVLLPDGTLKNSPVTVRDGAVADIGTLPRDIPLLDARGMLLLPGMVDIHGDAVERQIMPRPGVGFPIGLALLDTDRQLAANGITTAFHGLTWSWEPGLRSRAAAIAFMTALEEMRPSLAIDTRVHLRWETYNLAAVDDLEDWLAQGRVDLLAFNDHLPANYRKRHDRSAMGKLADRSGIGADDYVAMLCALEARRAEVTPAVARLAAAARKHGVVMMSHDDESPERRQHYQAIGCSIAEFPVNAETAITARAMGNPVVLGAPNVLRGGSHTGHVSAAEMVAQTLCSVLASDYYYPAMLQAPFMLVAQGACGFGHAWDLVAANPARAANLTDRGTIAVGQRADLLLVDDANVVMPTVFATFVRGRAAYSRLAGAGLSSIVESGRSAGTRPKA